MKLATVTIDVCCSQPEWAVQDLYITKNAYRLYINNELITERTWKYTNGTYIQERITLDSTDKSLKYRLQLAPIIKKIKDCKFTLQNLMSATEIEHEVVDDLTVIFNFK